MNEDELRPYLGKRVYLTLINGFKSDASKGAGTLNKIQDREVVWGDSLGNLWVPIDKIVDVEVIDADNFA